MVEAGNGTAETQNKADALYPDPHPQSGTRLGVLDGWRAISILAVMAGHWLPLNALLPGANEAVPATGMAIFFTLSGFLITRFMLDRPEVRPFLIRRLLRILPLAWGAVAVLYVASFGQPNAERLLLANLLFVSNLPPSALLHGGEHLWSLCVEMQFYLGIAVLVGLGNRRALLLLPLLAMGVTLARILASETISIITWHRVDEILAGATLALIFSGQFGPTPQRLLARIPLSLAVLAAAICCYFVTDPPAYLRPYAVAVMVGVTLYWCPAWLYRLLTCKPAVYVAEVSFALYVFHGMLSATWLGSGGIVEKYAKRPLLIAATFGLAHLSTFYYEQRFIRLAKRLTGRGRTGSAPATASGAAL